MAVGRANAGVILKHIPSTGLLLLSAILSFVGLFWLSYASGYVAFVAAGVFAMGICYFWPTMIGFVAEKFYKTGPTGLSLMGGFGLLSTALVLPFMGDIYGTETSRAVELLGNSGIAAGEIARESQLIAGAVTLRLVAILPAILIVAFTFLHFYTIRKLKQSRAPTPLSII